jgi:fatty acid desaturase
MTPANYRQWLKPLLPKEAFAPAPRKLVVVAIHLAIMLAGYVGIRSSGSGFTSLLYSIGIGNSLACIGFMAHELSHNAIVRERHLRYVLELLLWGLIFVAPTLWHKVHNRAHHSFTNMKDDPDRRFMATESSAFTTAYTRVLSPNHRSSRWNVTVGFQFVFYVLRNTIAAFYPNSVATVLVPAKPNYTSKDRLWIVLELVFIVGLHAAIFRIGGGTWLNYLFTAFIPFLISSCIMMAYIYTNHLLNPILAINDPLLNSTSVVVPRVFNRLHDNFSYHVEHHIFPNMNADYYPMVSQLLSDRRTDYKRIKFKAAWNQLWKSELFVTLPSAALNGLSGAVPTRTSENKTVA